jgi:hypothetical protein
MNQAFDIARKKEGIQAKLLNYFGVGYLLHSIGVVSLLISAQLMVFTLTRFSPDQPLPYVFFMWLSSFFFMNALFSQLDAYSRYQNFKQVRDQLYQYGYQLRIVKPLAKSKCQRLAAIRAGRHLGMENEVKSYYHQLGYRWFHVLPDFVNRQPLFFFHPFFWKSTFFVKRYRSRFF